MITKSSNQNALNDCCENCHDGTSLTLLNINTAFLKNPAGENIKTAAMQGGGVIFEVPPTPLFIMLYGISIIFLIFFNLFVL